MKVIKWLDEHFEETFLVFFLVLISCITMLQIIARTFFAALSWPEEFCRYCWIWSVFISLPYTMRKGNMLARERAGGSAAHQGPQRDQHRDRSHQHCGDGAVFQRIHHCDPKRPEQRPYLSRHGSCPWPLCTSAC